MKTNMLILSVPVYSLQEHLSSCTESWLDVASKTESNSSNYYKSQDDGLRSFITHVMMVGSVQFQADQTLRSINLLRQ